MSQPERDVKQPIGASAGASFDVHGIVGIDVEAGTPGEPQLRDMLAPFLGNSTAPRRITIGAKISPISSQSHAEDAYRFTGESLYIPADRVQIIETKDGYRIEGAGELLTSVIPLLDRLCVQEETAMIHAAVVDFRGSGVLLPAWGGVGKTSTVAKLVAMPDVRFMADDWAFMGAGGMLMGYAKPMFIKPHHRAIYPDMFRGNAQAPGPRMADDAGRPPRDGGPSGHCPLSENRRVHPALVPRAPHGAAGACLRGAADFLRSARTAGHLP